MAELEYRIKTTSMGAISRWRELTMEPDNAWDYQQHDSKIEYFEIRTKPTFEPGYFQCADAPEGAYYSVGEVVWMDSQGEIDRTDCTWARVNVTLAAE